MTAVIAIKAIVYLEPAGTECSADHFRIVPNLSWPLSFGNGRNFDLLIHICLCFLSTQVFDLIDSNSANFGALLNLSGCRCC